MKGLLLFFIAFILYLSGFGQKPDSFFYQALVRNATGELVILKPVSFRISILAGNASGVVVYIETQTATTNREGLISLAIGNGSDKTGSFNTIDWNADKYFLKVEADPESALAGQGRAEQPSNVQGGVQPRPGRSDRGERLAGSGQA